MNDKDRDKVRDKDREFSKKQVRWTFAAFWLQVYVSLVLMMIRLDIASFLMDALAATATLTGAVHVGYFGKAGAENWRKIGNTRKDDDEEETEG